MPQRIEPFDTLIDRLNDDGLIGAAANLYTLLHKVAWTTGSEFYGEFGQELKKIKSSHWDAMSAETMKQFQTSAETVLKVWPQIGL